MDGGMSATIYACVDQAGKPWVKAWKREEIPAAIMEQEWTKGLLDEVAIAVTTGDYRKGVDLLDLILQV